MAKVPQPAQKVTVSERKTAIWELAERALIKLGAYLPPSRHEIVTFCLLIGWQPLSTKGHLCHFRGSRLAILVYQGSDPTQPYPTLVIRQSATLSLRLCATRLDDVVRPLAWIGAM
jgi:hypothetical protein